jgi:ribosomal-protein-alanine N-acetyltransferase
MMNLGRELHTFPELETKRLRLRQLEPDDAVAVFRIFADEEVTRFHDLETFTEVEQAGRLIARQVDRLEQTSGVRWGLARKTDDVVIGTCGYVFNEAHASAGLGYELGRSYWRQGYMSEALRAVIRFSFERLELNRIQALVMPGNKASAGLLQSLGFQNEGLLREYAFFKDRFQDLYCFSLLRGEYEAGEQGSKGAGKQSRKVTG